jgi:hypothetical protein
MDKDQSLQGGGAQPKNTLPESTSPPRPYVQAETNFLRYPIASLDKHFKGSQLTFSHTFNDGTESSWRISGDQELGLAGELGAKIDLAITKLVYEARQKGGAPPRCIKTSFYEFAKLMGISLNGRSNAAMRKELLKLAATRIFSKRAFKKNGVKTEDDLVISKYEVFLRGTTLPDGTRSDGLVIWLGNFYYESLKVNFTKSINWDLAMALPPAASKIYQLLALRFGDRDNSDYVDFNYAELCKRVPIKIWTDKNIAKQKLKAFLGKLGAYLGKVEFFFERPPADWFVRIYPGSEAFKELKAVDGQRELFKNIPPAPRAQLHAPKQKEDLAELEKRIEQEEREHAAILAIIDSWPAQSKAAITSEATKRVTATGALVTELGIKCEIVQLYKERNGKVFTNG